jgi:ABC-type lipoprotein release transport system permease subunit
MHFAKHRYFLDFALSSLLRRKGKNVSLVAVYALVVFLLTSVLFFAGAIRREADQVLAESPELIVQRIVAGRHDLIPLSYLDSLQSIRGVRTAKPRLWGYYYHQASQANYTVIATDEFALNDDQIITGEGVLRTWKGVQDGRLFFRRQDGLAVPLAVKDSLRSESALVTADLVLMTPASFRSIFGIPEGFATDLVLAVRNPKESQTIVEKVAQLLPDTRPVMREEIQRTYASLFDWRSGYVIVLLSGAVLAFFIFAWDKATGLTADERFEIGILKAVGWDTADVLLLKFWEGMAICLSAFLVGVTAAYVHVFIANAPLFEHALKGWAVLYPSFRLNPAVDAYQLAAVFALTVLPYTLITIVPAWHAAVTDPDAVMR